MIRRILLAITFVAALGAAGLATPDTADAWRWRGRGYYGSYYGGPPRAYYYGYGRPYRAYYPGYYSPRVYRPYYYGYPGYYYGPRSRVAFSIGF
jgi:hypothetical protein